MDRIDSELGCEDCVKWNECSRLNKCLLHNQNLGENMTDNEKQLVAALRDCIAAMKKSKNVGCTDHLDCCDDAGAFWYDAIENGLQLIENIEDKKKIAYEPPSELQQLQETVANHDLDIEMMKQEIKRLCNGMSKLSVIF